MITIGTERGLTPLKEDNRDFSLAGIFDQIKIETVPKTDFVVSEPLLIKDQGDTDFCTAYAITEASEDQEGVELLPEYQFFKTKLLMGNLEDWGADLRTACKVPSKFGSLPVKGHEHYKGVGRSVVLNPLSWPAELDEQAAQYKKETFFKIDGRYDLFDNIRCALWQHRAEKRTVVVGAMWIGEWTEAEGGVVPSQAFPESAGYGHAFKIFGQKLILGQLHLMAQLSSGTEVGDNGVFYFPRETVNREFAPYGQFMFKDISRETAEFYQRAGIKHCTSWWVKLIKKLFDIL